MTEEAAKFAPVLGKSRIYVDGPVWIGDPCYAPNFNNDWDDWIDAFFGAEEEGCPCAIVSVNGIEMVAGSTAHGDGSYDIDGASGTLPVDAGLLCVIPEKMFVDAGLEMGGDNCDGCFIEKVTGDCFVDDDGTLVVGHGIRVITAERCEHCNDLASECGCERCGDCGSECDCERCLDCGEFEDLCVCEEEEED